MGRYENTYKTRLSEIEDAANISRLNLFKSRKNAIEAACDEFVDVVNSETTCIHEIERRTAAMAFYRKMIERAETILRNLLSFEDRLRKVSEVTSNQIQQIRSKNLTEPFTIDVTPEFVRAMKFDQSDVGMGDFLEKVKVSDLAIHGQLGANDLFNRIYGYAGSLSQTQKYLKTNLLEVLQGMPIEKVKELFLMLKSSIGILRRTDPDCPFDNARSYIIGVYDINHPAVSANSKIGDILNEEFANQGISPKFSNTKDINKIAVCAYESAVPALTYKKFRRICFWPKHKSNIITEELWYSNKHWGEVIMNNNYSIFPE